MQEYQLKIQESLTKGLRPFKDMALGNKFLSRCEGLKPRPWGLRSAHDVTNPFASDQFDEFPFPQLLNGREVMLLAGKDKIHSVGEDWSLSELDLYNIADELEADTVMPGGAWHMADFGEVWLLFNGSCVVISPKRGAMFGEEDRLLVQDSIQMNTGCAFRGRMVTGGFSPAEFWSNTWMSLWDHLTRTVDYSVDTAMNGLGKNFVMWTTIGGGDLLHLLLPDQAIQGVLKEAGNGLEKTYFLDLMRRNESGFMPMPWSGEVLCVKQLGKGVMVYGENGISLLIPVIEPFSTFGLQEIADFGIADRGAVGGDIFEHVFVNEGGKLFKIGADYKLQMLGYEEYLGAYINEGTTVSHDSELKHSYISNKHRTFVLTETGLGRSSQVITSTVFTNGELLGIAEDTLEETHIVTESFDFQVRDLKTVTTMEVGLKCSEDVNAYVAVLYRYAKNDNFNFSDWTPLNKEGFARIQITALEFRFCVKVEDIENIEIDYINVRWQSSASRTKRGLDADTANAWTDIGILERHQRYFAT